MAPPLYSSKGSRKSRRHRASSPPFPPHGITTEMSADGTFRTLATARHPRGWDERRLAIALAVDKAGPTQELSPSLFVWATVMSRPAEHRAIVDAALRGSPSIPARRSFATSRPRPTSGPPTSMAGSPCRHQPPEARRQDPADPRPLRLDRQPLRLVCLRPRQPRRTTLADHRPRRGVLTLVIRPSRPGVIRGSGRIRRLTRGQTNIRRAR